MLMHRVFPQSYLAEGFLVQIRFTHFDSFIKAHSEHLPLGITSAFLRMYVHTEADQELPLEVWSKVSVQFQVKAHTLSISVQSRSESAPDVGRICWCSKDVSFWQKL